MYELNTWYNLSWSIGTASEEKREKGEKKNKLGSLSGLLSLDLNVERSSFGLPSLELSTHQTGKTKRIKTCF